MEAKELRIGNYVIYKGSKCQFSIYDIVNMQDDEDCDRLTQPIPLTGEWLLNFGFNKSCFTISNFFKKDIYLNIDNKGKWTFNLAEGIGVYLTDIKHVHQLQNLYFALTNEELTIK